MVDTCYHGILPDESVESAQSHVAFLRLNSLSTRFFQSPKTRVDEADPGNLLSDFKLAKLVSPWIERKEPHQSGLDNLATRPRRTSSSYVVRNVVRISLDVPFVEDGVSRFRTSFIYVSRHSS